MRRRRDPGAPPGLRPRLWLAWLATTWERLWPVLWPATGVAGIFVALALLDLLPELPGWLHLSVLAGFAAGLAVALWHGLRGLRLPRPHEPLARLERASGLDHRPLTTLRDSLAAGRGDPVAEGLWRAHRQRAVDSVRRLRVGLPAPGLARYDPWALRSIVVLMLAVAVTVSWGDAGNRLVRAAVPTLDPGGPTLTPTLEVWINPPDYTGLPPRFLEAGQAAAEAVAVPAGSTLLAQLHGGRGTPVLKLDEREIAFEPIGENSFQATTVVAAAERLAVEQRRRELASWRLAVAHDQAPEVEFIRAPTRTPRSTLRLDFEARDDYGVVALKAVIRRADSGAAAAPADEAITLDLPLAESGQPLARDTSYHDLTAHPWAGLPVTLVLEATDAINQVGATEPFAMALPERVFHHPVARAIIEQRKRLTTEPEQRRDIARQLRAISSRPKHFYDDTVVFLALGSAQWRLIFDRSDGAIAGVQTLLWETALRIEDGNLSLAERELRAAEEALREALSRDAEDEELERLIDQLQQALDEYLRALAEEMQNNPDRFGFDQALDPEALVIEGQDLQRMIERMRDLARSGAKDLARQMLSQLQNMLENLRGFSMRQEQRGSNQALQTLRDLQDIINRQEELLNRTFRQSQNLQSGPIPESRPDTSREAGEQEGLRRDLGSVMRRLGEMVGDIPAPLGRAERAMREAFEALQEGAPGQAVGPQGRALEELRQGSQAAADQMMRQFGGQPGRNQGQFGMEQGPQRDPLGRPLDGFGNVNTSDVEIPDQPDLQKAREILDELRRRAGDRDRPRQELDYIERLLRRF